MDGRRKQYCPCSREHVDRNNELSIISQFIKPIKTSLTACFEFNKTIRTYFSLLIWKYELSTFYLHAREPDYKRNRLSNLIPHFWVFTFLEVILNSEIKLSADIKR